MSQLQSNVIANLIAKSWTAALTMLAVPFYLEFLGIESYGLIGFYVLLQALFSLVDAGLSTTFNRQIARCLALAGKERRMRDLAQTLERIYWLLGLSLSLIVVLLAGPISKYWIRSETLSPEDVHTAVVLMGVSLGLFFPYGLYTGGLLGLQLHARMAVVGVTTETLRVGALLLVLWKVDASVGSFFACQCGISAVASLSLAIVFWRSMPRHAKPPRFRKRLLVSLGPYAVSIMGTSALSVVLTQADKVILSKLLDLESFGFYMLAWAIAGGLLSLIQPVFASLFPRFCELHRLGDEPLLRLTYHNGSQLMASVVAPIAAVIVLFAYELVFMWTQDAVIAANTWRLVSILALGTTLNGLLHLPLALQLASGWTRLPLATSIAAVALTLPMVCFLAMVFGAEGAAFSWLLLNVGLLLVSPILMHKRLLKGEMRRWYFADTAAPVFAAFIVPIAARRLLRDSPTMGWEFCLPLIIVATFAVTFLATPLPRQLLQQLIQRFRDRRDVALSK